MRGTGRPGVLALNRVRAIVIVMLMPGVVRVYMLSAESIAINVSE